MTKDFERTGSAKDIYKVLDDDGGCKCVEFLFSDRVSILDMGGLPIQFPGLGKLRCAISGKVFQEMDAAGFNTHYISHDVDAATMQVFPLSIEELDVSYGVFANQGRIIGVEIIDRRVVTEKLIRRIEAGEIDRTSVERLLVGELGLVPGARLSPPFIECTTKYRDADVYVSDKQAANLAKLSLKHLAQVYEDSRKASDFLSNFFRSHGFDRKDGKCEGAWTTSGFMFADSISPDEMRLIGPDGKSHDKDPVREWFELNHPDWYASVLAAKKKFPNDKSQWPGYPNKMPPQKIIQEVVGRYEAVAVAINAI